MPVFRPSFIVNVPESAVNVPVFSSSVRVAVGFPVTVKVPALLPPTHKYVPPFTLTVPVVDAASQQHMLSTRSGSTRTY